MRYAGYDKYDKFVDYVEANDETEAFTEILKTKPEVVRVEECPHVSHRDF